MIWGPANLADRGMLHVRVSNPLRILAQIGPAIAALITVGCFEGRTGIKALLDLIVRIKVSYRWYTLVLLGPFAAWALAMLAYRLMGRSVPTLGEWIDTPLLIVLGAPLCLGEELGWRGFLLDRLIQRNSLLAATGWTAFWWGIWHLPAHLGQNNGWWFILFLAGTFPVSAVFTFTYSRTRSVFLCVLLHASIDAGANYWAAELPKGDLLYLGLMDAILWLAAIPVFVALAKSNSEKGSGFTIHLLAKTFRAAEKGASRPLSDFQTGVVFVAEPDKRSIRCATLTTRYPTRRAWSIPSKRWGWVLLRLAHLFLRIFRRY